MFVLVSHYVRMNSNRELGDFPIKLDGLGLVTSIQSIHVFIRVRDFEDFFSFSCDEFFPNLRWVRLKEPGCGREILRDPGDGWVLVCQKLVKFPSTPFFWCSSVACDARSLPGQHLTVSTSSVSTSRKNLPTEDDHNLPLIPLRFSPSAVNSESPCAAPVNQKKVGGIQIVRKKISPKSGGNPFSNVMACGS